MATRIDSFTPVNVFRFLAQFMDFGWLHGCSVVSLLALIMAQLSSVAFAQPVDAYQIATATNLNAADSLATLRNASSANICVNTYVLNSRRDLLACCASPLAPNQLKYYSARNDLISNTLTPVVPISIEIDLIASAAPSGAPSCGVPSSPGTLVSGLGASLGPPIGVDVSFQQQTLSTSELSRLTTACGFILENGSGFGQCRLARDPTPIVGLPTISSLNPNTAPQGGAGFTLTVMGTGFTSGAVVQWNGIPLTTSFGSATTLTAAVPANLIVNQGFAVVTVAENGLTSGGAGFFVDGPRINSLNPSTTQAGGGGFILSVAGSGFTPNSVVRWNNTSLTTTFVDSAQLTATVPATLIIDQGSANVTVVTGSLTSAVRVFRVTSALGAFSGFVTLTNASSSNICINTYVVDSLDDQLVACCSSLVRPNQPYYLSRQDLIGNTLTPGVPSEFAVDLLASSPNGSICNAAAPGASMSATGALQGALPGTGGSLPFLQAGTELTRVTRLCGLTQQNGGGFGICSTAHPFTPPFTLAPTGGTPQSATVTSPFSTALQARVVDSSNSPLRDVTVTFVAPASGASGTFAGGATTALALTNAAGISTAPVFTANPTAGAYHVTASVTGIANSGVFNLVNVGPPANITVIGGFLQSATVGSRFDAPLQATVRDSSGNPISGVSVTFTAPISGASGTFAGITAPPYIATAVTNAQGVATAPTLTANCTIGPYNVTATAANLSPAIFNLANRVGTPALIAPEAGSGQSTNEGTQFPTPLAVIARDVCGNPVPGATVTFTAPVSGASGTFASASGAMIVVSTLKSFPAGLAGEAIGIGDPSVKLQQAIRFVPSGDFSLDTITFDLVNSFGSGPITAQIYSEAGGLPGTLLYSTTAAGPAPPAGGLFSIPASGPFVLQNGKAYWLTAVNMDQASQSYWWYSDQSGWRAVRDIPGRLASGFPNWGNASGNGPAGPGTNQSLVLSFQITGAPVTGRATSSQVVTNASGIATAPAFTANCATGSYSLTAAIAGVSNPANLSLINTTGPPATIAPVSGTAQTATVNTPFAGPLIAIVKDLCGNPIPGVSVMFGAPASGSSSSFGTSSIGITNAFGIATSPVPTANGTPGGPYIATATVSGLSPATFSLTNLQGSVPLTITTSLAGLQVSLDGGPFRPAPISQQLTIGTTHTIATQSPQTLSGIQYVFAGWSDNGAISHTITVPASAATYTAVFNPILTGTTACPISVQTQSFLPPVAFTATGGTGSYTFSLVGGGLPANVAFNGTSIGGLVAAPTGNYPFTIQVNSGTQTVQQNCSISVTVPKLGITSPCPVSPINQGDPFSAPLSAVGGIGSYGWTTIGNLPNGLNVVGSSITGTPSGPPGTSNFTIQVSSADQSAQLSCSLTVSPPKLQLTSGCPGNGTQGLTYAPFTLTAAGGLGQGSYSFSAQGLPPGLSLVGNTVSGTPTGLGTFNVVLSVASGTQTVTGGGCPLTIVPPQLQITGSCPSAMVGVPLSILLSVSGGKPPYSFSPSLPAWLSLSPTGSGATLSGTPTEAGQASTTITVSDSAQSAPVVFKCALTVAPAPALQIGGSCPANSVMPSALISIGLSASGGLPPYSWSLAGPGVLSLSSATGVNTSVGGTAPADPGDYPLTITLSDSAKSEPASLGCTLNVRVAAPPSLQISGTCPSTALDLPLSLSVPFTASGGQGSYSWSLAGNPSWLGLSPTAGPATTVSNSGAPDRSGPFSFTVVLSDSAGSMTTNLPCSSSINAPPIPPVIVSGLTPTPTLFQPVFVGLQLAAPAPLPLNGILQLSFSPNAFGIADNPQVSFNGGTRQAFFTIAAGQTTTTLALPEIQQGTVAGTIRVEVVELKQGNADVLPTLHPFSELVIQRQAPVITETDITFANETANGFDVVISGFSTPRDMKSVTLTFTAAQGASLEGTSSFTVDVSAPFTQFYSSAQSVLGGSMFKELHVPISLSGDKDAIGSVSVVLTNSAGSSQTITKHR